MKKLTSKDSSYAFLFGFLLCQVAVFAVSIIGLIVCMLFNIDTTQFNLFLNNCFGYVLCVLTMDGALVGIFLYFNKNKDNKIISKPQVNKILFYILIAIASYFCLYPIVTCVDSLLIKLGIPLNTIPYTLDTKGYLMSILSLVILPAVCEELVFRGIIFKGLKPHGKKVAIIISALMFSIFHMSISQTIYPFLMGMLLCVIMLYENNILYTIIVHLINNFLALTFSYLGVSFVFNHWSYILLAIILACIFLAIMLYFTLNSHKSEEKTPITKHEKLILLGSIAIMAIIWIITLIITIL